MNLRIVISIIVLSLTGMTTSRPATANPSLLVGVLEDIEPIDASPAMSRIHVRVAFEKRDLAWVPLNSDKQFQIAPTQSAADLPPTVRWTVVFDGKQLGSITSTNPEYSDWSSDFGIQTISTDPKDIPHINTGARDFFFGVSRARTRPLVVVSAPHFHDPEHWKPTTLSIVERKLAIAEFRKRLPKMEQCDEPEAKQVRMVPYFDDEIVFIKAYRSRKNDVLFGAKMDDTRSKCGFFDDKSFFDYWFVLNKRHEIRLLDSQMTPVDAVDLDGDGHSEWIFQTSRGEDEDGYELFYDNFAKNASFHWTYH